MAFKQQWQDTAHFSKILVKILPAFGEAFALKARALSLWEFEERLAMEPQPLSRINTYATFWSSSLWFWNSICLHWYFYSTEEKKNGHMFILEIKYREILKGSSLLFQFENFKKREFRADLNNGLCSQERCALVSKVGWLLPHAFLQQLPVSF